MLCCLGLMVGFMVGRALGGFWTLLGPALGFGLGFILDVKVLHRGHRQHKME